MTPRLFYIELPVSDMTAKPFYERAFGWKLAEFGPSYAATTTGDVDIGLQADPAEAPVAPLPVIQVDDLEAAQAAVERAGGTIVCAAFDFPGGRRFHFSDPAGNVLAVAQLSD